MIKRPTKADKAKRVSDPETVLFANPGSELYGSDRMALAAVQSMIKSGRSVVVTVPKSGPLVEEFKKAGARVVIQRTPILSKELFSPSGLLKFIGDTFSALSGSLRLIRQTRAGTVMVNTITAPLWFPLARVLGRRAVCYVHEAEKTIPRLARFLLYLPLALTNRIIANSQMSLSVLTESGPWLAGRARVVYNAVAGPRELIAPERSLLGREIRLLFVGRLSHRKGPHLVIEALRILRERGVQARLSLLGATFAGNEGYEKGLHEAATAAGLSDRVDFLGFQPDIWKYLAQHDIAIIPSIGDESFGNTAVEAILAARPLIVSDNTGLKEASSSSTSRIAVPRGSAVAIADAVEQIADNWEDFSARALVGAPASAEKFSIKNYQENLVTALQ